MNNINMCIETSNTARVNATSDFDDKGTRKQWRSQP